MQPGIADRIYLRLYPHLYKNRVFHLVYRLVDRFFTDRVSESAAHLAYFFLFSLFPMLIFLNALIGLFHFDIGEIISLLSVLPQDLAALLGGYVDYLQQASSPSLLVTGLALTVWFFSRAARSLTLCINNAMRIRTPRSTLQHFALSVLLTFLLMLSVIVALIFVVTGQELLELVTGWIPRAAGLFSLWGRMRPVVMGVYFLSVLVLIYTLAPNRRISPLRALPGALFAMAAWLAASAVFSHYVDNIARYSVLYGSLGAIIILMLWLYILGIVLVLGAEINHIVATGSQWRKRQHIIMQGSPPHYIWKD